ncbi:hypothetical protein ACE3MZ_13620 [Paenibacillus sp. WLX1005]|uniref:hypothetical protein n=1 Tax=Paenibacillus sp. WLX1005 TaxID=3243766 RepID=UPI0039841B70
MTFQYPIMTPPFEVVHFEKMNKKQAQQHFEWFVSEIPSRLEILENVMKESGVEKIEQFDMTPQSLVPLWNWLKMRINTVPYSPDETKQLQDTLPPWIFEDIQNWKLDTPTIALAVDVSIYFGEVFIKKYPSLKWGFMTKPKSYVYINRPTIIEFKSGPLHPPTIVTNICSSYADGDSKKNLLSSFEVWEKFI